MSALALIPLQDYLSRTGKPNCEYIEGSVVPKPIPTTLHAWVQSTLILLLTTQNKIALPELTLRISETLYLVPDVAVVAALEFPYPTIPPQICIEILSPEDRIGSLLARCETYHSWGVPTCWVIDPVKQTAWQYDRNSAPQPISLDGVLRAGDITIPLAEIVTAPQ